MTVGQNIKRHREEKGLKQIELATMIGTSPTVISQWENEIFYPSLILLICLADAFEITLDELVGRTVKKK